jgi:hypothetical protein
MNAIAAVVQVRDLEFISKVFQIMANLSKRVPAVSDGR